jgi:hypothetical protein
MNCEKDSTSGPSGENHRSAEPIAPSLTDLLSLIPDGHPKAILRFCLSNLQLSSEEVQAVLYDAHEISRALGILLSGGVLSKDADA